MTTVAVASSAEHRKRLGQVFTGEPLARVLAALAQAAEARTIIDPMSGLGDMLVASSQVGEHRPRGRVKRAAVDEL